MYQLKESLYFIPNCTYSFSSQSLLHQSFFAGCRHLSLGVFIFHLDPHPRVKKRCEEKVRRTVRTSPKRGLQNLSPCCRSGSTTCSRVTVRSNIIVTSKASTATLSDRVRTITSFRSAAPVRRIHFRGRHRRSTQGPSDDLRGPHLVGFVRGIQRHQE